jgi:hypothetical protein
MKNLIICIGLLALFIGVASCKKDWTCTCSDGASLYSWPIENVKKSDAQATCDQLTDIYAGTSITCSIE